MTANTNVSSVSRAIFTLDASELCTSITTGDSIARKAAPARFGNRRRRVQAQGKCYACDGSAVGCAPRSKSGGVWTGGPAILKPACSRHAWTERFLAPVAKGQKRALSAVEHLCTA